MSTLKFALEWTPPRPPDTFIRYDHVIAESPIGRFSIEWKGWKEHDSYCLYLEADYLDNFQTLDLAKTQVNDYLAKILMQLSSLVVKDLVTAQESQITMINPAAGSPETQLQMALIIALRDGHITL